MKNSTFSAQVANNLLTLLQGYSKTIRLLLVMFLTLTVTTNAWGATITIDGSASDITTTDGDQTITVDGITFKGKFKQYSTTALWFTSGSGYIYNTTSLGTINSITINYKNGGSASSKQYFTSGNSAITSYQSGTPQITTSTGGKSGTHSNFSGGFFNISISSKNLQATSIVIDYTPAGGGGSTAVDPEVTFSNGEYTVGGAALDLTTLLTTNSNGAVTYSVKTDGGTGATIAGSTFTATAAGTCTVQVSIAATATHNAAIATADITVTVPATVEGTWTLVTNAANLTAGDRIVIAAAGSDFALSTTQNTNNRGQAAVTKNGNNITFTETTQILTLEAGTVDNTLAFNTGDGYLYAASRSKNYLKTQNTNDANGSWSISIDNTGVATVVAQGNNTNNTLFYNQSSQLFSCYANTASQKAIAIYKEAGGAPTYTITPTLSHVTAGVGNPTTITSEAEDLTLTYSAESGWNLPDAISVTMGGNQLMLNDGYTWDKETGTVWIVPTNGFTGNIVVTINGWQQLATPTGLSATNITSSSATLSWDAVDNASSYIVTIVDGGSHKQDYSVTGTTKTLDNLTPSTVYLWTVKAVGDGTNYTNSEASATGEFTTTAATYTITYVTNGGTNVASTSGTALPNSLPETTRAHYTFAGWYTDEGCTQAAEAGAPITSNTTLYAKWTPITYTVSFDAGSGTYTSGDIQGNFATGITLPTATPCDYASTNDWNFVGWSETTVSETTVRPLIYADTYKPTKNITLYAVYAKTGTAQGAAGEFILSLQYESTTYYVGQTFDNSKLSAETEQTNAARFTIEGNYLHYEGGYISHVAQGSANMTKKAGKAEARAWTIAENGNTITFTSTTEDTRGLGFNYNSGSPRFAAYNLNEKVGETIKYPSTFTKTSVSGNNIQVTTYNSNPSCEACENILSINKGEETNGNTFTLSQSGEIETCDGVVEVVVTPTPAEHYSVSEVTATTPTTGGAPTVIDNDNGTYTITYATNSTGESTINVTFAEDAKATITLYELEVSTTITTEYVGDTYTLPSTSSQTCGTKTLVGWSTIAFAETDTKPTEKYYGISTPITLAETQTFYAVFAQSNGGGGSNGDYARVTEALDDWSGDYLIAYNDQTFANGSTGGESGMGAGGNTQDLSSHINNNTIPANIGDLYNVTLVTVDGGYVLQTKDGKYNYQSSNKNGLATTDNIETAKTYPLTVTFNNENDIAIAHSHGAIFHYNKNSPGFFRFYQDGGQQPVYLYKKAGAAATYSGYTTSCAVITGIEVANYKTDFKQYDEFVFGGTVYAVDENKNRIDVTSSATFSGYDMKKAGTDTVTVTYLTHSTTYEITIEKVDAYALTWNVSGATNTGLSPAYVIPGNAIGKLPTPKEIPAGCEGKTFVGWTESNTVNSVGTDITFITSSTVPTQNTTYYAVFATPSGNAGDGDYVKVTEDANDLSGEYLIIYEDAENNYDGAKAFNGGLETLDAVGNTIAVTINDNTIASTDATNAAKFTIAKDGEGDYTIKSVSGKYIGRTANDNDLDENESIPYKNTITFTDGDVNIIASGGAYLRYNKASGSERFRYYKSSTYDQQQSIALYKKSGSSASYTDYTTGCQNVTITYYGFTGGYTTNCGGSDLNVIKQRVNTLHTIPNCDNITDPTSLGRTFLNLWKDQYGKVHQPGESFIVTEDITLYAQWALNTSENTTLPTDVEDLATTDIVVTGGTTLTLQAGTTTINSLTLKGGLQADGSYALPVVNIPENATLVRKNTTIYLDLVVNAKNYYPFAVPFRAKNGSDKANWDYVGYIDPVLKEAATYRTHFVIKTYDGAKRAANGENRDANWVIVNRDTYLEPGKGYIISAMTYPDKNTATIRIPMTVPNEWLANGEQESITVKEQTTTRNQVAVTAYTGQASDLNTGGHQRHAGWNFVANPYLANFAGTNASGSFTNGEIIINKGDYSYGGEDVPYVTIPTYNFAHYYQRKLSEATLSPAYSFFVQVSESGTMSFDVAGRQVAPASIAARNAEERPVKMDVDLILSDNHSSDQTGIIISDRYNDTYEIGRDLEKLFGSAYNLSVYTLMADNTPLAFQALAIRSNMQVIPVGYRAPEQGEYTFRLNEATSSIDLLNEQYEQLVLVDYQTGELTNLLISDYTFYSERTQADNRFAIYAVTRQNAPTDLPNAIGQDKQAQKIIHNGHLYILRDGNVYNGNGQIVK